MVQNMFMLRLSIVFKMMSNTESVLQVNVSTYHIGLLIVPDIE
jgi:hypothetical protein